LWFIEKKATVRHSDRTASELARVSPVASVEGRLVRASDSAWHVPGTDRTFTRWHNASDVKLRNAHRAIVARSKVLDHLLNEAHPPVDLISGGPSAPDTAPAG
jgi:hypothetical protein